ncbi:beta-hexosaminidase [Sporanaerobium hydrogeniformans]|uniref:Beta-hexosaminidase n=1 Tax=Sporanaerobium hydrogeniformans TaxID=3072179 RepID=A0AC61DEX6_9FIRM|nr:glycoside hydrolase family 3 N-terminal domain-containing protein [Sporanaerobium hydrogeniformans]PHV71256.1 beta-hexosaminidase [Sporanaerobium hydrogeniformans]
MKGSSEKRKVKKKIYGLFLLLALVSIGCFLILFYKLPQKKQIGEVTLEMNKKQPIENAPKVLEENKVMNSKEQLTASEPQTVFRFYEKQAKEKLLTMSLEEKVGQLFLARCPDVGAIEQIKNLKPAGYVLFSRDFKDKTKEEVINTINAYQEASTLPMLMAVDEEGGSVVRISSNPQLAKAPFKSPQALEQEGGLEAIRQDAVAKAKLLKELGISLNLAPVADVTNEPSAYMYGRAFGKQALETAEYVVTVVKAMQKAKLASTLKHFPGYGSNGDTHTDLVRDTRPLRSFKEVDLIPFQKGIEQGVESILVSHSIVEAMDSEYPASLSSKVHKLLREELGFTGVIMTDDLAMEAISLFSGEIHPAVLALQAGNDLILISDLEESCAAVLAAVKHGEIEEALIDEAVSRTLAWKYKMEIIK